MFVIGLKAIRRDNSNTFLRREEEALLILTKTDLKKHLLQI